MLFLFLLLLGLSLGGGTGNGGGSTVFRGPVVVLPSIIEMLVCALVMPSSAWFATFLKVTRPDCQLPRVSAVQ